MGRLLNEKEIINKNIESYLEKSTSEYSRFLESTPSFVTYYSKAIIPSTVDEGLEDTHNYIGSASSRKYKRIYDFPIYGIESITLELNKEDWGAETNFTGSGIILPDTIKPLPQDYFTISYIGKLYLFRINNVVNDKLNGKNYYSIEFSFNKLLYNEEEIKMQITGEYATIFNNIGTKEKCVIEQNEKLIVDHIEKIEEKLIDFYNDSFLDNRFNLHLGSFLGMSIYNQMATNFIRNNAVLKRKREFMNSTYIEDVIPKGKDYLNLYRKSIYFALEQRNAEKLDENAILGLEVINHPHTPFSLYRKTYYNLSSMDVMKPKKSKLLMNRSYSSHCCCCSGGQNNSFNNTIIADEDLDLGIFGKEFLNSIKNFILYDEQIVNDTEKYLFENLVIKFLNGKDLTNEDLDMINSYPYESSFKEFYFIPLIIYILKMNKENLLSKIVL